MNILITGATGFIGKYLSDYLETKSHVIDKASVRDVAKVEQLDLSNVDVVVHLAALVHQMEGASEEQYMLSNFIITQKLADRAKQACVKHFIFISTVKVYQDNNPGIVFNEDSDCLTEDAYGKSKLLAENYLKKIQSDTFKVNILRLPLVYGPEVKGNFINLLDFHAHKKIIPFKNIKTKRSMVYVGNVCAMIEKLMYYDGQQTIFIALDCLRPCQLNELSSLMLKFLKRKNNAMFCSFPWVLKIMVSYLKPEFYKRIFSDFVFDAQKSFHELDYKPAVSIEDAIEKTCQWYNQREQ